MGPGNCSRGLAYEGTCRGVMCWSRVKTLVSSSVCNIALKEFKCIESITCLLQEV